MTCKLITAPRAPSRALSDQQGPLLHFRAHDVASMTGLAGRGGRAAPGTQRSGPPAEWHVRAAAPAGARHQLRAGPGEVPFLLGPGCPSHPEQPSCLRAAPWSAPRPSTCRLLCAQGRAWA